MKRLVFASGIWNIMLGLNTFFSGISDYGSDHPDVAYLNILLAFFLFFTSATLVLCSINLADRGSIVFWEGYLRIAAAAVLISLGVQIIGNIAFFVAVTDLAWAAIYQIGLCKALNKSYWQLLTDQ